MAYLLDTHVVIWLAHSPNKLSDDVKLILSKKQEKVYFSTVNLWEIVIKNQLDKPQFNIDGNLLHQNLLKNQYIELPVLSRHCLTLQKLPRIHSDPFDRLLIAQAQSENLTLITHDTKILQYEQVSLLSV